MIEARLRELQDKVDMFNATNGRAGTDRALADAAQALIQAIEQSRVGEVEWKVFDYVVAPVFISDHGKKDFNDFVNQRGQLYFSPEVKSEV